MSGLPTTSAFNDGYIAELYDAYRRDPASVDESWRQFFRFAESLGRAEAAPGGGTFDASILRKTAGAAGLVAAIERFGHLAVTIDPLGSTPPGAAELEPEFHGISESDLDDVPATALGGEIRARNRRRSRAPPARALLHQPRLRVRTRQRRDREAMASRDDRIGRGIGAADRRREEGAARPTHRRRRARAIPRAGVT